jgi:hypothetical protein
VAAAAVALGGPAAPSESALPEIRAAVMLPPGWKTASESEDGVFVIRFARSGKQGELPAMTLSVTTKVAERTGQTPSEYAAALVDSPQDDGTSAPVQKGMVGGLPSLRSEDSFDGDAGKMRAVNIAVPNDKSGTLYFFAWQAPMDEPLELEAIRENIVATAKFDPAF